MKEPSQHNFSSIAGHAAAKNYLSSAKQQGLLPHALIISGPSGIGKLSLTYALAKLLNCTRDQDGDCTCDMCRKISDRVFADLLVIEPKGASGQITLAGWKPGKDDPDGLQYYRFVDSRPLEGSKKLVIFQRAERMNVALANFLLKLIEEPPSYLLVVLLTTKPKEVIPTIRSRCAPLRLSPLARSEMEEYVTGNMSGEIRTEARRILPLAEGRPGRLVEMIGEAGAGRRAEIARLMRQFQQNGFLSLFRVASDLLEAGKQGDGLESVLQWLQTWIRDAMILKSTSSQFSERLIINSENRDELAAYAAGASLDGLAAAAEYVKEATQFIPRMTDRSYVMETLLLKIGKAMK